MIGLGSIVNAAAIVAGGCVGLVAGKAISERVRTTLVSAMAVGTLFVGASSTFSKMLSVGDGGAVECRGALMLVMSLAIGAVVGEIVDIDGKLERFGVWLHRVSHNENDGSFLNGFITASLTYCIGAMAINEQKRKMGMKTVVLSIVAALAASSSVGSEMVKLPAPDGDSGVTVTQALKARHSERAFADKELSHELLSGVLWAANGFNRPDKRTNATGLNKQEITVYAIMKSGAYRYDAKGNALVKVCDGDLRPAIAGHQPFAATAPVSLLIAADVSDPIYTGARSTLSNYDAGIVSGNIYLYCAANGLATVCRRSMNNDALKKALKLPDTTILHLNHPVGYPAGGENAAVGAQSAKAERNREGN